MTNEAFFSLDADDPGFNEVVHDAASWIYLSDELTVVTHNLRSDDVIFRHTCYATHCCSLITDGRHSTISIYNDNN